MIFAWVIAMVLSHGRMAYAADAPTPKSLAELDAAIEATRVKSGIPGMGVAVIEDGKIVLIKGYGLADVASKTPATADTLFRAGSISKTFIGLSAMMLVEDGKLSLDQKMSDALPEIPVVNPYAHEAPIRLVHLLEHTSGWGDYSLRQFNADGRGLSLSDAMLKDAPYVSRYAPGQFASYSNPGAAAAALMVERAAGVAYGDFVWARLFKPIGMLSATYDKPERGLATSYESDGRTSAGYAHLSAPPIGALNISVRDLAQYPLLMLGRGTLNGQVFLKPESVARIERVETTTARALGLTEGYGLANLPTMSPRAVFRGHDGAIDGALSTAAYWPGHGAGYVVMWTMQVPSEAPELIRAYLTRNAPDVPLPKTTVSASDIDHLAGQYSSIADRQPLVAPFTALFDIRDVGSRDGKLTINGEDFAPVGPNIFRKSGQAAASVAFDLRGREPRLYTALGAFERLSSSVVWQRILWSVAFSLLSLIAIIHAPIWLWGLLRGRLGPRGGIGMRLLPLMSLGSIYVLFGFFAWLQTLGNAVVIPAIGGQSYISVSVFVVTLLIPVFGFMSFWRGLTAGYGAGTWIRLYAMAAGLVTLIAAAYLNQYGWIGIQTWTL